MRVRVSRKWESTRLLACLLRRTFTPQVFDKGANLDISLEEEQLWKKSTAEHQIIKFNIEFSSVVSNYTVHYVLLVLINVHCSGATGTRGARSCS